MWHGSLYWRELLALDLLLLFLFGNAMCQVPDLPAAAAGS